MKTNRSSGAREKIQKVLARTDTDDFVADDWKKVLDGCCGGCPPELGTLLENLQLASPRSTLDAQTFLDAVFPGSETGTCALRIIQITDVYILDNFPHLKTLIREKEAECKARYGGSSRCISMLTGDFLAPYLLSSIDRGAGMIRMLNETPIDYVTWGNHEADLSHSDVMCRVDEYKGVWINSNMRSHESFEKCPCQREMEIIELAGQNGQKSRKVGLVAVLSNEPNLYKPGAFGGATIEDPWETLAFYKKLLEDMDCDLMVPLCHLYESQDEITCRKFDFPVILSGHDHHIVDRFVDGTRLLKPGSDAHHAIMLDIIWDSDNDTQPRIEVELLRVADFGADLVLADTVKEVYSHLDHLRNTHIVKVPASYRPLSSINSRGCCTSAARFLCSEIRCALNLDCVEESQHCDCVLINGGNFRGERDYKHASHLSLEDLMSEIDQSVEIVVAELPGWLLKNGLRETWGVVSGAWMQYDDLVEVNSHGEIIAIGGKVLNLQGTYRVGSTRRFGIQLIPSIAEYWKEKPDLKPNPESGVPVHSLLLHFWAEKVWIRIWAFLDQDNDGSIDSEEIKALDRSGRGELNHGDIMCAVKSVAQMETFEGEYTLTDLVMKVAGQRGDGCLTLKDLNRRRRMRRRQLRMARTREANFPAELLPDADVQDQQNVNV